MQRKVTTHRYHFADITIDKKNRPQASEKIIEINGINEVKAKRKAIKLMCGQKPYYHEIITNIYEIDDETFFKYATIKK